MTFKTPLQELFAHAAEQACRFFAEHGEILPMWFVHGPDDRLDLAFTPFESPQAKQAVIRHMAGAFKESGVKRYVFMCEGWVAAVHSRDEVEKYAGRTRDHPDRREVLHIVGEDQNGEELDGTFYILRPEHGPPTLSPLHMHDPKQAVSLVKGLLK